MAILATLSMATVGCAVPAPYEAEPTSVYQWQRRQDEIQARQAERARLCATLNKDSARVQRDCGRPGDPN